MQRTKRPRLRLRKLTTRLAQHTRNTSANKFPAHLHIGVSLSWRFLTTKNFYKGYPLNTRSPEEIVKETTLTDNIFRTFLFSIINDFHFRKEEINRNHPTMIILLFGLQPKEGQLPSMYYRLSIISRAVFSFVCQLLSDSNEKNVKLRQKTATLHCKPLLFS